MRQGCGTSACGVNGLDLAGWGMAGDIKESLRSAAARPLAGRCVGSLLTRVSGVSAWGSGVGVCLFRLLVIRLGC